MDRLDLESLDFHNKVYNGYLEVSKMFSERIIRINGEVSPKEVVKSIIDVLNNKLER